MASATPTGPQPVAAVAIIPPTATTQGTDRSIWPSRITIIIPVAMTPRNDATFNCCSRYCGVTLEGRFSVLSEKMATIGSVFSGTSSSRRSLTGRLTMPMSISLRSMRSTTPVVVPVVTTSSMLGCSLRRRASTGGRW